MKEKNGRNKNSWARNYDIIGILLRFILYAIIFGLCGMLGGYITWNSKIRKFDSQ